MRRYKYWICERDIIEIAHGNMDKVHYYSRKPKQCIDAYCDFNSFVEVLIEIANHISDGKNKSPRKKLDRSSQKRKVASKKLSRLPRDSSTRRPKNTSKKNIP